LIKFVQLHLFGPVLFGLEKLSENLNIFIKIKGI
jgi:hypothetical protein